MRFLILISFFLSTHNASANIDLESQNLIDLGIANGLEEVNDKGLPDNPRFKDNSGLSYLAPKGGWIPTPGRYPDRNPASIPKYFYRTVKDCKTQKILSEQIIFTYNGYENYVGGSRYKQQCILDGTFDSYYEEGTERMN